MPEQQQVLHFCNYKPCINICIILVMGWVWETETVRQQIYSLGDWGKIGPLSNMFHSSLTSFKTNKQTQTWKTTPIRNNPTTTITQSSSCIYENKQTKIKDGNKVFPKKLDIKELNPFVYKELYILNSYNSTQSGLLHCPAVKLEGGKKSNSYFHFYPNYSSMKNLHFKSLF